MPKVVGSGAKLSSGSGVGNEALATNSRSPRFITRTWPVVRWASATRPKSRRGAPVEAQASVPLSGPAQTSKIGPTARALRLTTTSPPKGAVVLIETLLATGPMALGR